MKLTCRFIACALVLGLLTFGCSDISPVTTEDLCKKNPPHQDCEQCRQVPRDSHCPQCLTQPPDKKCANATGGAGGAGGSGGAGRNAMGAGKGGTGVVDGGPAGVGAAGGAGTGTTVDAGPCGACPSDRPACVAGMCVACGGDGDCQVSGKRHCDASTHECVGCVRKADCGGNKTECDPTKHECVECLVQSDCKSVSRPTCEAGTCIACRNNDDCIGRAGKPLCDMATASATLGQCVQCITGSDCANPTPQCSNHQCIGCTSDDACTDLSNPECNPTGSCIPCTADAACIGRPGTEVCDTAAGATQGKCVQCTGAKYAACKQGSTQYVCESLNRVCSATAVELSADVCSECVSDAQCQMGKLCVKQLFDDPTDSPDRGAIDIGYFCAWHKNAGVGGAPAQCSSVPPYVNVATGAMSMDGATADVCVLRVSTCPALTDFSNKDCAPSGTADDNQCGSSAAPHDGYCVLKEVGPPKDVYQCTVPCGSAADCKPGFTCNGSNRCSL